MSKFVFLTNLHSYSFQIEFILLSNFSDTICKWIRSNIKFTGPNFLGLWISNWYWHIPIMCFCKSRSKHSALSAFTHLQIVRLKYSIYSIYKKYTDLQAGICFGKAHRTFFKVVSKPTNRPTYLSLDASLPKHDNNIIKKIIIVDMIIRSITMI